MNIDINQVLDQMAQAFNTTVDKLYPILIKQAYVNGISSVITIVITISILVTVLTLFKKHGIKREDYRYMTDSTVAFIISSIVVALIAVPTVIFSGHDALTALINPEYWAIKEILNAINPRN